MAKLILEMQMSLDGFIAGVKGQTDWMVWNWGPEWTWDKELQQFHTQLTLSASHIILSRQMAAEGFIGHWQEIASLHNEQAVFAEHINKTPKTVISTTLTKEHDIPGGWNRVEIANDPTKAITELKRELKANILVYGGATLVSNLLEAGLIDELYLLVNPVVIGNGMTAFRHPQQFQLENTFSYASGMILLHYSVRNK